MGLMELSLPLVILDWELDMGLALNLGVGLMMGSGSFWQRVIHAGFARAAEMEPRPFRAWIEA